MLVEIKASANIYFARHNWSIKLSLHLGTIFCGKGSTEQALGASYKIKLDKYKQHETWNYGCSVLKCGRKYVGI